MSNDIDEKVDDLMVKIFGKFESDDGQHNSLSFLKEKKLSFLAK